MAETAATEDNDDHSVWTNAFSMAIIEEYSSYDYSSYYDGRRYWM
jgi:hypothetical protein